MASPAHLDPTSNSSDVALGTHRRSMVTPLRYNTCIAHIYENICARAIFLKVELQWPVSSTTFNIPFSVARRVIVA